MTTISKPAHPPPAAPEPLHGRRLDPHRFAAHEAFFVEDIRRWATTRLAVRRPAGRTTVFGVSAGAAS
jgi:hypothetical protein